MEEIWRSIEIEGYEVSNFGRVRSVDRTVKGIDGVVQKFKGQLIKPFISKGGYACVIVIKDFLFIDSLLKLLFQILIT